MKTCLFFCCLLIDIGCFAQAVELDLAHKHIGDLINSEKSLGSMPVPNRGTWMLPPSLSQPVRFSRKSSCNVDFIAAYTYFLADSTLQRISYSWEYQGAAITDTSNETIRCLLTIYDSLIKKLTHKFPGSDTPKAVSHLELMNSTGVNVMSTIELDNGTKVILNIGLRSILKTYGNTTETPFYQVALDVIGELDDGTQAITLNKKRTRMIDSLARKFLGAAHERKWSDCRKLMVDPRQGLVGDDALAEIASQVGDPAGLLYVKKGIAVLDKQIVAVIQYRDKPIVSTDPPKRFVAIAFTSENLIYKVEAKPADK